MIDTSARGPGRTLFLAGLLGTYAAAIALAPSRTLAAIFALPLLILPVCWWLILNPSRWLALFFFAALLLPPVPLPMGDSGPHPAIAVAGFGLFAGILQLDAWRVRSTALAAASAGVFLTLLASVAFAAVYSGLEIALGTLARVGLFGISLYVFFYTVYGPGGRQPSDSFHLAALLYLAAVASAIFACLDFYFQFPAPAGFSEQYVWLESGVFRRAQGIFYDAGTLGNFCAFFLVMNAVALFTPRAGRPVSLPILLVGGVFFAAALIFSYSRASALNLAAAVVSLLFLNRMRIPLGRLSIIAAICTPAAWILAYFVFPEFARLYWARLLASAQYFISATDGVLSGRLESWRTLIDFLLQNPWHLVFGVGYKTLPYSDFTGRPVIADNAWLSSLVETGLLGFTALLLFHGALLAAALRAARSPRPRASFFGTWVFCFWIGQLFQMLSGDLLTYWRVLPVYFWVLALAVRESEQTVPS